METSQQDELGPVDVAVIGYPPGAPMTGEAVPLLLDLVDRGIIRVLDVMFVRKEADGSFSGFDAIMYENRWAAPFVAAVRRNGGSRSPSSAYPTRA